MAKNPGFQGSPYLPEPPPPYTPRTPPPAARANVPPPSLQGTLMNMGKEVGSYVKNLALTGVNKLSKALDQTTMESIKNGNVLQFVSRGTGRTLQILQAPDGHLVLDGLGGEGHQFFNAHFTVVQDADGHIMLHNNFNYLSIVNGITQLFCAGPAGIATKECRFKIREVFGQPQFVTIESVPEKGRYIAIIPSGQVKSALVTTPTDKDTNFAIRLIYSPLTGKAPRPK